METLSVSNHALVSGAWLPQAVRDHFGPLFEASASVLEAILDRCIAGARSIRDDRGLRPQGITERLRALALESIAAVDAEGAKRRPALLEKLAAARKALGGDGRIPFPGDLSGGSGFPGMSANAVLVEERARLRALDPLRRLQELGEGNQLQMCALDAGDDLFRFNHFGIDRESWQAARRRFFEMAQPGKFSDVGSAETALSLFESNLASAVEQIQAATSWGRAGISSTDAARRLTEVVVAGSNAADAVE